MQLQINNLSHAYGANSVLTDLDLQVAQGESMVLLGPSGCGKTTLLRVIAGLDRPLSGEIHLGGRRVTSDQKFVPPEQRKVGMVFQDWALFPHLNVQRNVAFGLTRAQRSDGTVSRTLDLVGLTGFENRMPAELSGGQQQRVALARALAPRPQILLLDEPFSNLDSNLRATVRTEVRQLLLDLEITTVLVTHDQDEAFVMGDRVGVLHEGALAQVGTPAELYSHPVDRFVANFVGTASWLNATGAGDKAHCRLGELPLTQSAHGSVDVMLRPEQLAITPVAARPADAKPAQARPAENRPADTEPAQAMPSDARPARLAASAHPLGVVSVVEYYGHDIMAVVALGNEQVRVRCEPDLAIRRGDEVRVCFVGSAVTQFEAEMPSLAEVPAAARTEVPAAALAEVPASVAALPAIAVQAEAPAPVQAVPAMAAASVTNHADDEDVHINIAPALLPANTD